MSRGRSAADDYREKAEVCRSHGAGTMPEIRQLWQQMERQYLRLAVREDRLAGEESERAAAQPGRFAAPL
jgi:hypothetical protein